MPNTSFHYWTQVVGGSFPMFASFGFPFLLFISEAFCIFGNTYHPASAKSVILKDSGKYDVTINLLIVSKSSLKCSWGYLQYAFKILLSAWRKYFINASFDLLVNYSMALQPVSAWNPAKTFAYLSSKLLAIKVRSISSSVETNSGTLIFSSAGANRKQVWQIHHYRQSKHSQLVWYWPGQKTLTW